MTAPRLGVQLYTFRNVAMETAGLVRRVAAMGYEGVEFATRPDDPDAVADALADADVGTVGAHVDSTAFEDVSGTLAAYAPVEPERLVLAHLPPSQFASTAAVADAARTLERYADAAREVGVAACYHNHDHEFRTLEGEGRSAYDALAAATDVALELDVGWARAAGADPVALIDRYGDRMPAVHLKDVDPAGNPCEFGAGVVDLDGCVDAASDAGVEWLVVEDEGAANPVGAASHAASLCNDNRKGA